MAHPHCSLYLWVSKHFPFLSLCIIYASMETLSLQRTSLTLPSLYPETVTLSGVVHFYFPRSPPLSLNGYLPYFFTCFCSSQGSFWGFPGDTNGKEPTRQCRRRKRHGLDSLIEKVSWRRAAQPTGSIPSWRIQWTEEPGGLQSMGCRVRHDWSNFARMHAWSCSGLPPVSV